MDIKKVKTKSFNGKCFEITLFLVSFSMYFTVTFAQSHVALITKVIGNERVWINNITVLRKEIFLVNGIYKGSVAFGNDTLSSEDMYTFITQFKDNKARRPMLCSGSVDVFSNDKRFFFVAGYREKDFKSQTISKFNLKNKLIWEYSLSLIDSLPGSAITTRKVVFDKYGNTYVLYHISNGGRIQIENDLILGPANLIVKLDTRGDLASHKVIFENINIYTLKIYDNKVCAYGGIYEKAIVLDSNLQTLTQNDQLNKLCQFDIGNKNNYFRIMAKGARPPRIFSVEKYTTKKKELTSQEVFRDTLRFQDEIFQKEILDFNSKKITSNICIPRK